MNIRDDVLSDLRDRGLSDGRIAELSAEELFNEYCNWHGLLGWGHELASVLDHLREATVGGRQKDG